LALGVASCLARNDEHARAATGLIVSLLLYNVAVVVILVYAGVGLRLFGILLWPAVIIHIVMAVWCLANLVPGLETRRARGKEVT
jgi:hypothetical protein